MENREPDHVSSPRQSDSVASPSVIIDAVRGTSLRPLGRTFNACVPLWVISPEGNIVYVSAACAAWLRVGPTDLVGRSVLPLSAPATSADPLDLIARSLAPPIRQPDRSVCVAVCPPREVLSASPIEPRETTFIPLPTEAGPSSEHTKPVSLLAIAANLVPETEIISAEVRHWSNWIEQHFATQPQQTQTPLTLGTSLWATRLRNQIALATANPTSHVLLSGPRGSGCTAIAQVIHATQIDPGKTFNTSLPHIASGNNPNEKAPPTIAPLVRVAGALMDAELFEATTGDVVRQYAETYTAAIGIVVEEIDQMPFDAQERLRQLIEGQGKRLRVFATASLAATKLVEQLQPTLAEAIYGIEISLPPLSSRTEDLPFLAVALLKKRNLAGETPAHQLSRDLLDRLINYPWPNNFQELDEAIRSAARRCTGTTLQWEHLPLAIRTYGAAPKSTPPLAPKSPKLAPLDETLEMCEREHILAALRATNGNRAAAARILQISRPRLLRRMDFLHLHWPP